LTQNRDNKELAKVALRESYSNIVFISPELRRDPEIAMEIIKCAIRDSIDYLVIDNFIKSNFKTETKNFKKLYKFFREKQKEANRLHSNDLLKVIEKLSLDNSSIYEKSIEKKMIVS